MRRKPMRVSIEVLVEIDDPSALIAAARDHYERSVGAVDVDGMTTEEALAVADLTVEELRAHPRRLTPRHAIPDGAAAALAIVERALADAGAMVESSATKLLSGVHPHGETLATRRRSRPGNIRGAQGATRSRKGRSRSVSNRST